MTSGTDVKGCISFSLYGDQAKYTYGMLLNLRLAREFYPTWAVRVYIPQGHYASARLQAEGAEVVEMPEVDGSGGMFWRFLALDDSRFTHVIVRDADSRVNPRDAACTEEWVRSGKTLHVIRDHYWHEQKPIIGGAWGMLTGRMEMKAEVDRWPHNYRYGDDEEFLAKVVWPRFYPDSFLRHCHNPSPPDDTPIPSHPPYQGFICEQIAPVFQEPHRVIYLSPEKFASRRERLLASIREHAPFLSEPEWFVGSTDSTRLIPRHFDYVEKYPHYYMASADHTDILEKEALAGTGLLFVFEDDAQLTSDFGEFLMRMWMALPLDWLGAMLGGQPPTNRHREYYSDQSGQALARVRGCLGMHAMLWNREGMLRAWNHFHYWNRKTIDDAFVGLQKEEPRFYAPAKWIVQIDPEAEQFGRG